MSSGTCYMCNAVATSVEHVPPKCLFPEQKDLPAGTDLRKQLITVPSCDAHNTAKSKDDEYLLYALLLNVPNNGTAKNHAFKKVLRAVQRNPSVFAQLAETQLPVLVEDTVTGQVQQTVAMRVDLDRLKSSLVSIGQALYVHHFGERWYGKVLAYPHFVLALTEPDARELNRPNEQMATAVEIMMKDTPRHGENPEVFTFQVTRGHPPTVTIMHLRFYEGSRATLLFRSDA